MIPPHWASARLGELADIQLGKMLDKNRTAGASLRYLRNINVRWDHVDTSELLEMPFKESELARFDLRSGDVLVCEGGEPGRSAVWKLDDASIKYQKALHRVRFEGGILPRWLVFHLYFDSQRGALTRHLTGTTIKHFTKEALQDYVVHLPPVPEQHRIVEAIESYFTRLDDAVATLDRVQRNLKRYRASVLKAAIEGRLVPTEAELARDEGRDYEPASVLLEHILAERRRSWEENELAKMKTKGKTPKDDKWKARYEEPIAPQTMNLPSLPEGWCWASVEQLGFIASGQTPKGVTSSGAGEGDVPWFRVGDMNTQGNELHMVFATEWLTFTQVNALGLHVRPAGTIVFPKRGGAIGTNKKRILRRPSAYDLNTMGIIPMASVGPFLWTWFQTVKLSTLADGSNVPQINHGDVAFLPVPLPPAAEQDRLIAIVNALLSVNDDATSIVANNRIRAHRVRQSILKWAFEGRLVDQDPTDESASVLLERIKTERAERAAPQQLHRTRSRTAKEAPRTHE